MFFSPRRSASANRRVSRVSFDKLFEVRLKLLELENRITPATFTVTNTNDSGAGSLRQAIIDANATGGADIIDFSIGSGAQTIALTTSALDTITEAVTIDGTTQPGYAGVPLIELRGDGVTTGNPTSNKTGITIGASSVTIQALLINGFTNEGVWINSGTNNIVQNNHIGTDQTGTLDKGNGGDGVFTNSGADGNFIVGNVISGNDSAGVFLSSASNTVQGNRIGTNAAGTADLGNSLAGVWIFGHSSNVIGVDGNGTGDAAEGNVISGNDTYGIFLQGDSDNTVIAGNLIGTNAAGTAAIGNTLVGISYLGDFLQDNTRIGTNADGTSDTLERNIISGNLTNSGITDFGFGTLIAGNYVGLAADGITALAGGQGGISLAGKNAIVGGTATAARNVISGNSDYGVSISGGNGFGNLNTILGNYIGTDFTGTIAVPNTSNGIQIESGAVNNTIGGSTAGARNVISGNTNAGVQIAGAGTTGNNVQGNYIGTNATGTAKIANDRGVYIEADANGNIIGTDGNGINDVTEGNLISGNAGGFGAGIQITSSDNTIIAGNVIGLQADGNTPLGNVSGIVINDTSVGTRIGTNADGTSDTPERNVIAGSSSDGIWIANSSSSNVAGNYIGTNVAGTAAVANNRGIIINSGSTGNFVGGPTAVSRNVVSGNSGSGILFDSDAESNTVIGNYIGTDVTGNSSLANGGNGVQFNSTSKLNFIGGVAVEERNIISGNTGNGVLINTTGSDGQFIYGNYIGLDVDGEIALGNLASGIFVSQGQTSIIAGNVVSGNALAGIEINGSNSKSNTVRGNYIGLNAAGDAAVANGNQGLVIANGATLNTVGGTSALARNTISGNNDSGVVIDGSGTSNNTVIGNYIGTNAAGTAALPNPNGLVISGGATNNTLGGGAAGAGNVISGNTNDGISLGSDSNFVQGNFIGTNAAGTAALANTVGISIGASSNLIGTDGNNTADTGERNVISGNNSAGILIIGGGSNTIAGNYIGTRADGTGSIGNFDGIFLQSTSGNIIGTDGSNDAFNASERNIISGNDDRGIVLDGNNIVAGNWIGVDVNGNAQSNQFGIQLTGVGARVGTNADGFGDAEERNVISGNSNGGIIMSSEAATIAGNYIGLDPTGLLARGNAITGIHINTGGKDNIIGGSTAATRNVIAANGVGVSFTDSGTSANKLLGNYIGTDKTGNTKVGNNLAITMGPGTSSNQIGEAGAGNVISGTTGDAVRVVGSINNSFRGNIIGLGADGSTLLANGGFGLGFYSSATGNIIGGSGAGEGNIISGNGLSGIDISDGSTGIVIQGNYIGTDATGTVAKGNNEHGIVSTLTVTIGGTSAGARNVISGNAESGIALFNGSNSVIQGNFIGTNAAGNAGIGNGLEGIDLQGSTGVTVGGTVTGAGNVISGNGQTGVLFNLGSNNGVVAGNIIGLDASGDAVLQNSGDGVQISVSNNVQVGSTNTLGRNILSGNTSAGVAIVNGSQNATIIGNYIGTDITGTKARGNLGSGVGITSGSTNNTVGGTTTAARNVISGNTGNGILVAGATTTGNFIRGNFIGLNEAGTGNLGNANYGILLETNSTNTTIGGDDDDDGTLDGVVNARNVIVGAAATTGTIQLRSGTNLNNILGNYIGTDKTGNASGGGRGYFAINGAGANNTIGGTTAGAGNLISGAIGDGIDFFNQVGGLVIGNTIGLAANGTDLGNTVHGISISGTSSGITIGGITSAARNVISGNDSIGVQMTGAGVSGNNILGNFIGTNVSGTAAIGNATGVQMSAGANNNTVGGTVAGSRNLISGNSVNGIAIISSGSGNTVAGNYIGTDVTGTARLGNGIVGVSVVNAGSGVTIGGATAASRNLISGNDHSFGINVTNANNITVRKNYIGTDATGSAALGNRGGGIVFQGPSGTGTIQDNVVSGNKSNLDVGGTNIGHGIETGSYAGVTIAGNIVGLNAAGTAKLGNTGSGISSGAYIGGSTAVERNIVSSNAYNGIVAGTNAIVRGNYIGTDITGTLTGFGNAGSGVLILGVSNVSIGGTGAGEGNVISGNVGHGVLVTNLGSNGNAILGNLIGTDKTGASAVPNSIGVGVRIGATGTIIGAPVGSSDPATANRIRFNATGVQIEATAGGGNLVRLNQIYSNTTANFVNATGSPTSPSIGLAVANTTYTRVMGSLSGTPGATLTVDFYEANPGGESAARRLLGTALVVLDGTGSASYDLQLPTASNPGYGVVATVSTVAAGTSAFGGPEVTLAPILISVLAPTASPEGTEITLASRVSTNRLDAVFTFEWTVVRVGFPGTYAQGEDNSLQFTPTDNGIYRATLAVRDIVNNESVAFVVPDITVSNVSPFALVRNRATNQTVTDASIPTGGVLPLRGTFTDPGSADTHTVQWFVNGVAVPGATGADFNFSTMTAGRHVVTYRVTDKDGGVGQYAIDVTVRGAIGAVIANLPTASREGVRLTAAAQLDGLLSPTSLQYSWIATKNGALFASLTSTASEQNDEFTFTPDDNGSYVVTLTVTDPETGATAQSFHFLTVDNVAPTVRINPPVSPPAVGQPIVFSTTVSDPGNNATNNDLPQYLWTVVGPAGFSTPNGIASTFSFTPTVPGVYFVSTTVNDKDGGLAGDSRILELAAGSRVVNVTGLPTTSVVEGTTLNLSAAVSAPGVAFAYSWTATRSGVTVATGVGGNFALTLRQEGDYSVRVVATGSDGSIGISDQTIAVTNAPPAASIAASPAIVVEGSTVEFVGLAADPAGANDHLTLAWTATGPGITGSQSATGDQFSFTLPDDGLYIVTFTVTDPSGAVATATRTVTGTNAAPLVTILNNGSAPGNFAFKASVLEPGPIDRGSLAYQWYVNGTKIAGATAATFTTTTPGTVAVEVQDDDALSKAETTVHLVTGTAPFIVPTPAATATQVLVVGDAGNNTVDARSLAIPVVLDGGAGDDTLYGGVGDDVLIAGAGSQNLLDGGSGNNRFIAGDGNDTMMGGVGNDVYLLQFSQDVIADTGGYDTLDASGVSFGINLNMTLTGPQIVAGTRSIDLAGDFERLIGTSSNDTLYGGDGDDIDGGPSADLLVALADGVTLYGGDGDDADMLVAEPGATGSILDGGGGNDTFVALAAGITLYGGDGMDDFTLSGDAVGAVVQGGSQKDTISSAANNVTLYGGDGEDEIAVINGNNVVVVGGDGTVLAAAVSLESQSGNDTITVAGGTGITLYGGDGEDTQLIAGGADVVANGNAGSDTIVADATNVTISGDGDADQLVALAGDGITLYGGDDDDYLVAGGGSGTIIVGGTGDDKLVSANPEGSITLYGGDGEDELIINPTTATLVPDTAGGIVELSPAAGSNIIAEGGGDNDLMMTQAGASITLYGGDGDDVVLAEGGETVALAGGEGSDILIAAASGATITLYGGDGDDTLIANPEIDRGAPEIPTSQGPISLPSGTADAITLYGGDGHDDLLIFGGDSVVASGNEGQNTYLVAGGTNITLYGGDGEEEFAVAAPSELIPLPGGGTLPAAPAHTITIVGGGGDNNYTVASGTNITLYGGDGDEDFSIMGGANIAAVGDIGSDNMSVAGSANNITLYGGDGEDDLLIAGGENVQANGNADSDEVLVADGVNVVVRGLEGQDTIVSAGGEGITLYGGDDDDTIIAMNPGASPILVGGDGNDRLIANPDSAITLYGGDADEVVIQPQPDGDNVILAGNQGADTFIVQGGSNITLYGGDNDDQFILDDGDTIVADGGAGADAFAVLAAGSGITLFGGDGEDEFLVAGGEQVVVHGNAENDSITVAGSDGWFYGDSGSDALVAGLANNVTLYGGSADERILTAAGAIAVNLYGGDGDDLLTAVSGSGSILVGNDGNDKLVVEAGSDITLYGLAGDDRFEIHGGTNVTALGDLSIYDYTGVDQFTVTGGTNVNIYGESLNDIVEVAGGNGVSVYGGSGNDILSASAGSGVLLAGNSDSDLLQGLSASGMMAFGGTGNDLLYTSGLGGDILVGEEGDDRYQLTNPVGSIVLTLDEVRRLGDDEPFRDSYGHGTDVLDLRAINQGISLDLSRLAGKVASPADIQTVVTGLDLVLFGIFDQVWGTPFADTIIGNDANNTFLGFGGNDTLAGGNGNDTLVGGDGDNMLVGGDGSDVFRFQYGPVLTAGIDTIVDNAADTDLLDFSALSPLLTAGVTSDLGQASLQSIAVGRSYLIAAGTGIEGAIGTSFDDTFTGTSANDWLIGGGGNDSLVGGNGSDTLAGGSGDNTLLGGGGNDWYDLTPDGIDRITDTSGYDSIDFSQAERGVAFTLVLDAGQIQTIDAAGNSVTVNGTIERLLGSSFDDILTGNAVANEIIGRNGLDILNGAGGNDYVEGGYTQVVLLDFDTDTRPGEYVYSPAQRLALETRFNTLFSQFGIRFVSSTTAAQVESARYGGRYATIRFNSGATGGVASEIDPRNVNLTGLTQVNAYDFLARYLPGQLDPALIDSAMLELSYSIGAHELGHLLGLRHADAFGPIGSGIYVGGSLTPQAFRNPEDAIEYEPETNATETGRRIMASPLSLGIDPMQSLANPGLGEREALKLMFGLYGSAVGEQLTPHDFVATAMPLDLKPIIVPNTLRPGDLYYGATFSVFAAAVSGSINLDGSGRSENDYYAFGGKANDLFTFEISSRTTSRFAGRQIDGILKLYNAAGQLIASNDDDFESQDSLLVDVKLPADGTYYIVVDTFSGGSVPDTDTGRYELLAYRMTVGSEAGRGDTIIGSAGEDTLRSAAGPDVIQITADATDNLIVTDSTIAIVDITQNPLYDDSTIVGDPIVIGANSAPIFTLAPAGQTVAEGSKLSMQFTAIDPDFTNVVYDLVNPPAGASIDAASGLLRWQPTDNGTFTFQVRATDVAGVSTTTPVTVAVTNAAPTVVLTGVPASSLEGTGLTFGAVVSDASPVDLASGMTYSWTITNLAGAGTVVAFGSGKSISYTPTDNGNYRVSVSVTDKDLATGTAMTDFLVTNVAPNVTITSGAASVAEGSVANFTALGTDPSSVDTAAGFVYTWKVNGTTRLAGAGLTSFSYTPTVNRTDTVTVEVADVNGGLGTASLALPVTNVAPTIDAFAITTPVGSRLEGSPLAATVTFSDPGRVGNGGTETYLVTWIITDSNGQSQSFVTVSNGGGPVSLPAFLPIDNGAYDLRVTVAEDNADQASATNLIAGVVVLNVAPTAAIAGPASGFINDSLTFTLTATDPGSIDQADNFTFRIDWNNDGIVDQTVVGPSGLTIEKSFDAAGFRSIGISATDRDGAAGAFSTTTVDVLPAENKSGWLTIHGTAGNDDIRVRTTNKGLMWELNKSRFGPFQDITKIVVFGGNGNDEIHIEGSVTIPAEIHGEAGRDTLRSGAGNDTLHGGADNDELVATTGDDLLFGDGGNDTLRAGTGNDTLHGGEGNDDLRAHTGNDLLFGDAGDDTLRGGAGYDSLYGGDGNDDLRAGTGHDVMFGEGDNDVLRGGQGNDSLFGGSGNDEIRGGGGDDLIDGGTGFLDTLEGGDGNDTITDLDGAVDVRGGSDADSIILIFATPPFGITYPSVTIDGGTGNDAITITSNNSVLVMDLSGGNGDDTFDLSGTWQWVDLRGGSGKDTLRRNGSAGLVTLHGIEVDVP